MNQQNSQPPKPGDKVEYPFDIVIQYFQTVWSIIAHPVQFFSSMPLTGGVARPLAFALVTHWLGSAVAFLWRNIFSGIFRHGDLISAILGGSTDPNILTWLYGLGSVISDPFITLVSLLFTASLIFIGARILVSPGVNFSPREITFESAVRITAFGMTPAVFSVIPAIGPVISSIYTIILTMIGAREIYRIGTGRAALIALFPKLIIIGIIISGMLLFAAAVVSVFLPLFL
ncbi:MAG: YIP1 family protein [Bdellovibrionota bacterium]